MKLLTATAILLALSAPAWAIADQDNSAISQQQAQQQTQNAYGGQARAAAAAAAQQRQTATGGQGGAGGSVTVTNSYSGGNGSSAPADPGYSGVRVVAPPSIANVLQPASGDDCPGVGLGAGGSGPTGAGILSYTWEGPHCTARRDAKLLIEMGHPLAAEYVMFQASDDVRRGLEWEAKHLPAAPPRAPVEPFIVGFCADNPTLCDRRE